MIGIFIGLNYLTSDIIVLSGKRIAPSGTKLAHFARLIEVGEVQVVCKIAKRCV